MPESLIRLLNEEAPRLKAVFNPWRDVDPDNDAGPDCPAWRREQLAAYLDERLGRARMLLVAEALGYQGGHFTGIAMTSESILLGGKKPQGISPEAVLRAPARRTSRPERKPGGFSEPTATIVWGTAAALGLDPRDFLLWNAFPWHPYRPERGLLSNRTPRPAEVQAGRPALETLLGRMPARPRIFAVGRQAEAALARLGLEATPLRHPAHGGAGQFRRQWAEALE